MKQNNLSAVLYGKGDLRMVDRPTPSPGPQQLLIRVHTVGICGSDVHYWTHGAIGPFVVHEPMVLGHETSGTVAAVGSAVKGFKVGDRVAVEPGIPCRICRFCKEGRYNLCPEMQFYATPPVHGSLARFVVHDSDFCFRLPDNVTMEEAALLEPLNVAVHACRRAHLTAGQNILVLGAGPIGLLTVLVAKAMGAAKLVITDLLDARLKLAEELGADKALNVSGMKLVDVLAEIEKFLGEKPEVAIECTGAATAIETGIEGVMSGGVVVLVGLGSDRIELPIVNATVREVDLRGVFRYVNCYRTALNMVASGVINLKKVTRAHYTLEQSKEAFERFLKGDVVKVFIHCDETP
ncbi:hypothetical protein AB6A40_010186 [Gnathostoma spinigerum]|uniref:Sorbitol dehydrogenase n=1 Tax=Gnathostoma spinigerum TaxID=75299 RepID=A0ABD6F204_9BILA